MSETWQKVRRAKEQFVRPWDIYEGDRPVATRLEESDADAIVAAHNAHPAALVEALREIVELAGRKYVGGYGTVMATDMLNIAAAALNSAGTGEAT